jgi:hypothetical protein
MWPFFQNLARTGGTRAAGLLNDFMRQQIVTGARRVGPQVRKQAEQGGLTGLVGDIRQAAATPLFRRSSQAIAGTLGIDAANQLGLTGQIERGLNQVAPALDRFFGSVTPEAVQKFGREQEKKGLGGALELATPFGFLAAPFIPNTSATSKQSNLNPIQTGKYGPSDWYSRANPAKTPSVDSASAPPSLNLPTMSDTPTERAYQQEKSSVAQQTAQDPLVKKYQVAELTKAYNAASPEDKERIGLQIWATTNPTLAKQVRPGQVGYQTSASMSGSQVFGKDIPGVTQATYQQASEQVGAPGGVLFPGSAQAGSMNAFGMGANAQQLGVSVPGQVPPSMIGENVFKKGFDVPSSENLTQTQLALLKRAFEGRLK